MKNLKWVFVLYSLGALITMMLIGVAVGMRSIPLMVLFLILLGVIMGFGFKTKKKFREDGKL
ncbi:YlaF family protein [Chungangia koreensis]|uniref:YlaF family protein n=1 Tax=Chungangia koreensis TaxID=752657 RepID=A0ABV8X1J3_9LACT